MRRRCQLFWTLEKPISLSVFEFPPDLVGVGDLHIVLVVDVDALDDVLEVSFVADPGEKH